MGLDFPEGPHSNKRPLVLFTSVIITGVSILVLGWPTGFVLKRLGVTQCSPENAPVAAQEAEHFPEREATCIEHLGTRLHKVLMTEIALQERRQACEAADQRNHDLEASVRSQLETSYGRDYVSPLASDL